MSLYEKIYALTMTIPRGRVASYGQIARAVGCSPRQVGYAMAALPFNSGVPWHRVINSHGRISTRSRGDGARDQRALLETEGIRFDGGKVRGAGRKLRDASPFFWPVARKKG